MSKGSSKSTLLFKQTILLYLILWIIEPKHIIHNEQIIFCNYWKVLPINTFA